MDRVSQHTIMAVLKQAQVLDKEIYDLTQRVEEIPLLMRGMEESFSEEGRALEQLIQEFKSLQVKQKDLENDLGSREANVKKYESQLTQVKTNKEYSALQQEIQSLKADISIVEEKMIALFDEIEGFQKKVNAEKERLSKEGVELKRKKQEKEAEQSQAKEKIQKLTLERNEILVKLEPDVRRQYEAILRSRRGTALSVLQGENCGACQILIRPQLQNEVNLSERIVTCENCGRILIPEF